MMSACLSQLVPYAPNGIIACRAPGLRLACAIPRTIRSVCARSWRSAV